MVLYVIYFEDDTFAVFEDQDDAYDYGDNVGLEYEVITLEEDQDIELPTGHILTYEEAMTHA